VVKFYDKVVLSEGFKLVQAVPVTKICDGTNANTDELMAFWFIQFSNAYAIEAQSESNVNYSQV
jgi:hypothetical protein